MPEVIIVPALFFLIGYICWLLVTAVQRSQRTKLLTQFNGKLLDRLGSVNDFSQFLQTEAGAKFMRDLASEPLTTGPQERIMRAAQISAVLICLGLGLLALGFVQALPDRADEGLMTIGVIALSLGIGFAASAATAYRLAAKLGLLRRDPGSSTVPAASHV
jgi:hypothetical protein